MLNYQINFHDIHRNILKKSVFLWLVLNCLFGCQSWVENSDTTAVNSNNSPEPTPSLENKSSSETQQPNQARTEFMGLPVALSSRFVVKPEKREEFIKLATEAAEQTQKEPGNLSYSFYEEITYPNSFIFFEEWKSRASLDKHLATPYTKQILDKFGELVEGEPSIRVYYIERTEFRR